MSGRKMKAVALIFAGLCAALTYVYREPVKIAAGWMDIEMRGGYSVEQRLAQFGAAAEQRLGPYFAAALPFPPDELAFLAFKDERRLDVFGRTGGGPWRFVRSYPILGASGTLGPKLREGDRQVPEGGYRVTFLNPNSRFHVSLRLDYPNAWDREMGQRDGRENLGSDIMIHGKSASVGCLAMGDEAAEELFTLAARVRPENVKVLISPTDLRKNPATALPKNAPPWTLRLYRKLKDELSDFARQG